jgi:1,4-dihydroxy-2-naphthoate polyprenyltransferase
MNAFNPENRPAAAAPAPKPSLIRMVRAPFLSSIVAPIVVGTLVAVSVNGEFRLAGFFLALTLGVGLHVATNVYNDIYDTIQGSDRINMLRNEFSGGSGILVEHPEFMNRMRWTARGGLVLATIATIGLMFVIRRSLWPQCLALFAVSVFLSKYYTAGPIKLAYRGLGEFFVWFAFGPMAVWIASVSQNLGWHALIAAAMPATGISTLSILLIGQIIDLPADEATGKHGIAVRMGVPATVRVYGAVQLALVLNLALLAWRMGPHGWPVLLGVVPVAVFLPGIWKLLDGGRAGTAALKEAAKANVRLHLLFSLLFIIGLLISLSLK